MSNQQMPQNQVMPFNRKPIGVRSPPFPGPWSSTANNNNNNNSSGFYWASHPSSPAVYYDRETTNYRLRVSPSPPWTPGPQWPATPACPPCPYFSPPPPPAHCPPTPNAAPQYYPGPPQTPHYPPPPPITNYPPFPPSQQPHFPQHPPNTVLDPAFFQLHYSPSPPLSPAPPPAQAIAPCNKYSLEQFYPEESADIRNTVVDLPPVDPHLLNEIEKDSTKEIYADGIAREIRYYGETAIILIGSNDAREVSFETGSRSLVIDKEEEISLNFNSAYREVEIDGKLYNIRLGAPTRELFIDGQYHEILFGSEPVTIMLGGRMRMLQLKGPMPKLRIGKRTRNDLLAGKVYLTVDARHAFPIYLDRKPQKFDINGVAHSLQFVNAFHTVLINGVPFKFEFGSSLLPIHSLGEKHYLRFTSLPEEINLPGYENDVTMQEEPLHSASCSQLVSGSPENNDSDSGEPLKFLISLLPANSRSPAVYADQPISSSTPDITTTSCSPALATIGNIDAMELLQKLVASGIVPAVTDNQNIPDNNENNMKSVDFSQPKTLRIRRPDLIPVLYNGIQCSSCGERFPPGESRKYREHLDWHFRQNRRIRMSSKIARSRRWYYSSSDWIKYQEIEDEEDKVSSWFELENGSREKKERVEEPTAMADSKSSKGSCSVCQDEFELFYSDEKEEWQFRNALYIDHRYYHPICYHDYLEKCNNEPPLSETEIDATIKFTIDEVGSIIEPELMQL
ncbi:hypothetical protein O3M35_011240 [Rhynocoris fuscipes]|uniref:PCFS4-like zinc finger domain-containing protein n=1 Tax=Rhynocoris fuscipes TaxID=488301 RepID=A0AAW1D1L9_9HEMI